MRLLSLVLTPLLFLASCALTPERASRMSSYDLCRKIVAPLAPSESKRVAELELERRSYYCDTAAMRQQLNTELNNAALREQERMRQDQQRRQEQLQQLQQMETRCTTMQDMYGNYHTRCW